jgi:hypothetical protein
MTTILLGCGAICSDRLKLRYETRKQDKKDYEERFEELKAENAKRQSWIDSHYQPPSSGSFTQHSDKPSQRPAGDFLPRLPSYEDATSRTKSSNG